MSPLPHCLPYCPSHWLPTLPYGWFLVLSCQSHAIVVCHCPAMAQCTELCQAVLCWCHPRATPVLCHDGCALPGASVQCNTVLVLSHAMLSAGGLCVLVPPAAPDSTVCPQVCARAVPAPRRPLLQLPVP